MLCPSCGTEVGDQIQLCDSCSAERQARLDAEEAAKRPPEPPPESPKRPRARAEQSAEDDEVSGLGETAKLDSATPKKHALARKIFLGSMAFLGIVAIKMVKVMREYPVEPPVSQAGTLTPTGQPAISATPAELKYLSSKKSGMRLGATEVHLQGAISLYDRPNRKLHIAFFRDWEGAVNDRAVRLAASVENVGDRIPEAIMELTFVPGATKCGLESVAESKFTVFRREDGLKLPESEISIPVKKAYGSAASGSTVSFDSLECAFEDGSAVIATFRGSKAIQIRDETPVLNWDLQVEGALIGPGGGEGVQYRSAEAKTTIALWDKEKSELNVGFFAGVLDSGEQEMIRRSGGFGLAGDPKPDAVFSATFAPGQSELKRDAMKTYGVLFYRGRAGGLEFPGSDEKLGVFFVSSTQNAGDLEGVAGELSEQRSISGTYRHSLKKDIQGKSVPISWDISFHVPVMDTAMRDDQKLAEAKAKKALAGNSPREGSYALMNADNASVEGKSVVALYYPGSGDLGIGFYTEALSQDDVDAIRKRKSLSAAVNGKRPTMVLFLDFPPESSKVNNEDVAGYTAYFYREVGGEFQFPGFHDAVSIKRTKDQFPEGDSLSVNGNLGEGATVKLQMKGSGSISGGDTKFAWDLRYDVPVHVSR